MANTSAFVERLRPRRQAAHHDPAGSGKRVPEKRRRLGGRLNFECRSARPGQHAPAQPPMIKGEREGEIAYAARSKYVTSARIPHGGRPSPDNFGLTFHVATPLQDQVGVITPNSLHYFATPRCRVHAATGGTNNRSRNST